MKRSLTVLLALTMAVGFTATTGAASAAVGACPSPPPGQTLSPAAVHGANVEKCGLAGVVVRSGAAGAAIPESGGTVEAHALSASGSGSGYLRIAVSEAGDIEVTTEPGDEHDHAAEGAEKGGRSTALAYSRCTDGAYALSAQQWSTPPSIYVNSTERLPAGISKATFEGIASSAFATWGNQTNACGLPGGAIVPGGVALGAYTYDAAIGSSGSCGSSDGRSVMDFGPIDGSILGYTCRWWDANGVRVEADVRLDNSSRSWVTTTAGCSGTKYHLGAVTTHELGHYLGLSHVTEYGGNDLTMSPTLGSCNGSASSLGAGDVWGVQAIYQG